MPQAVHDFFYFILFYLFIYFYTAREVKMVVHLSVCMIASSHSFIFFFFFREAGSKIIIHERDFKELSVTDGEGFEERIK